MSFIKALHILIINTIVFNCASHNDDSKLVVIPEPIDAIVNGEIILGPSTLNDPDKFVWGASVIEGDDGKYHMFYSTWEAGSEYPIFSDGWLLLSKIAYAVSDYPDRNFEFQKIVLKGRIYEGDSTAWDAVSVHNPHIKKFNGRYYLYYTGSYDPGPQPKGSQGYALNKRDRIQQSQQIGVIEFGDFNEMLKGHFKRPDSPLLSPRTRVKPDNIIDPSPKGTAYKPDNIIVVNPSVVYRPSDSKYLLYFKGNLYDPHWKGIHGVAIGNTPGGPFKAIDKIVFDIKLDDGKIASAEDPYVWYHKRHKMFYAVIKDFSGNITEHEPGLAILKSIEGIEWENPENPFFMIKELFLNNGNKKSVSNLERPQFLIDSEDNPQVLYSACSIGPVGQKTDGSTFNVHIKLKSDDKK
jgi:hypothetical protein